MFVLYILSSVITLVLQADLAAMEHMAGRVEKLVHHTCPSRSSRCGLFPSTTDVFRGGDHDEGSR